MIGEAIEAGVVQDAIIAQSQREATELWAVRDSPGEWQKGVHWPQLGFDVSVPTGEIGPLADEIGAELKQRWPELVSVFFGHVADGNLHVSVRMSGHDIPELDIENAVYGIVAKRRGSISAEHGIGSLKIPVPALLAQRGRDRADARHQARHGPEGHPESGQGAAGCIAESLKILGRFGRVEGRILDDAQAIAEGILHGRHADAFTHIGDGCQRRRAQFQQAIEGRLRVRHAPVGLRPAGAGLCIRYQPQLEAADTEAHVEGLVEVGLLAPAPAHTIAWRRPDPEPGRSPCEDPTSWRMSLRVRQLAPMRAEKRSLKTNPYEFLPNWLHSRAN